MSSQEVNYCEEERRQRQPTDSGIAETNHLGEIAAVNLATSQAREERARLPGEKQETHSDFLQWLDWSLTDLMFSLELRAMNWRSASVMSPGPRVQPSIDVILSLL